MTGMLPSRPMSGVGTLIEPARSHRKQFRERVRRLGHDSTFSDCVVMRRYLRSRCATRPFWTSHPMVRFNEIGHLDPRGCSTATIPAESVARGGPY